MVKVLIVDDQPELRYVLQVCLRAAGLQILEAGNGRTALDIVPQHTPEIIVLDVNLPDMNGFEICTKIRRDACGSSAYIIMLSSHAETRHRVCGLESGADAYMAKPFQPDEFMAQLKVGLRAVENRKSYLLDPLTGIFGRRAFDAMLEQSIARSHRHKVALSMLMIDVDRFKSINDTHGHQAGDKVLRGVTQILREQARNSDLIFRWGGEEFVWLLSDTDATGAVVAAERFRQHVAEQSYGPVERATVSVGVATLQPAEDGASLSRRADEALYQAKQAGRNCVQSHARPKIAVAAG